MRMNKKELSLFIKFIFISKKQNSNQNNNLQNHKYKQKSMLFIVTENK